MELTESNKIMEAFDWSSNIWEGTPEKSSHGFPVNYGVIESGFVSSSSMVLDNHKGELVDASVKTQNKGFSSDQRSIAALKNHS